MSQQPMCRTCRSITADQSLGVGHQSGGLCANCWEVERRICAYLRSSRGLRKVLAAIHNEVSDDKHFEGL